MAGALFLNVGVSVKLISYNLNYVSDHWDGTPYLIDSKRIGIYQGGNLNWGGFDYSATINSFDNTQYVGYNTNWGQFTINGMLDGMANDKYSDYNTNFGGAQTIEGTSLANVDNNTVKDHPKDQKIYYKLRGYNQNTQSYETWIISHNITGRPSLDGGLFDSDLGQEPPNVERDVFTTPPSGNALDNIIIVGRWIE